MNSILTVLALSASVILEVVLELKGIKVPDLVLLMSVNPGFGGQEFMGSTLGKVKELKIIISASGSKTLIEVDGGINEKNAAALRDAGADVLVAGSAIFKSKNMAQTISRLKA